MPINSPSGLQQRVIFWASLLLIITVSSVSFLSSSRLVALSARAQQSQHVLIELNRYLADLQDVETGARGYLITGDSRYLEPYRTGKAEAGKTLMRLRAAAGSDPSLRSRVTILEELGRRRSEYAAQVVSSRPHLGLARAPVPGMEGGQATMDELRDQVRAAAEAERSDFESRKDTIRAQALLTNLALTLGVALSLAALTYLFVVRNRETARVRLIKAELRALNADLEDRVEQRTAEVERSKELLDAVIENMPDTVFLKDIRDQFRYVLINGAGERLLGRQREELLGHVDHELFPQAQAKLIHQEDQEVASSGRQRHVPERSIAIGDECRTIETRKVPIADSDGRQRFVLGIVRDITEQKSIENQLRQVQRMDAVGRLTGGIAHDFNNILAIILGNIDLLREQLSDGSETADMADEALGAATHGAELVRRLLAFARKQHLEPTALDLNERLPSITAMLRRTLGEKVDLKVHPAPALWPALVDPTQVDDALVNLAINARDAMPDGGALTIETGNVVLDEDYAALHAEVTPGEYVMLAVSDNGTGMTSDIIAKAFEPFFSTKGEGKGTGLGLSQVYGWVKQSGGHIKIYSEIGHGTTIKLYLPRADAAQAKAADLDNIEAAPVGSETILVVEDNPNVLKTVLRQLKDLGYSTIEADNGRAALEMVRNGLEFDMLLTDVVMPGGMTGYELAGQVGALKPDLKVLFTSGYTELATESSETPRLGRLLSKPYRKQDLGRAIRATLDGLEDA